MATPTNPPDSPPKPPVIPEGLATKLGKYGALLSAVLAALAGVFDVELNTETYAAFAGSVVLLLTTMWGRYKQAEAIYRDAPSPFQIVQDFIQSGADPDEFEDFIEAGGEHAPSEDELKQKFPDNPPESGPGEARGNPGEDPDQQREGTVS